MTIQPNRDRNSAKTRTCGWPAAALQAEVPAYIDAHLGEVDENGYRLVVRNGYHGEREVLTAAGAVPVRA
jgi:putative transposase